MNRGLLSAIVVATIVLAPGLAQAKSVSANFEYGVDRSSWYWKNQREATVGDDPQLPGGVVAQERVDSPQAPDTLPVAAQNGEPEKISTILFNLAGRGVTVGSTITKMTITLTEGSEQTESPSFNAGGKKIQACAVSKFWPAGEAELWGQKPDYDQNACATGKRSQGGTWTFNLTSLAASWGENPSGYNGVALLPVVGEGGPAATWQLNLKIPNRGEYNKTKKRAQMTLEFTPPPAAAGPGEFASPSDPFAISPSSGFSTSSSGAFPTTSGSTSTFPSSSSTTAPGTSTATAPEAAPVAKSAAPGEQTVPQLPTYVWLLIPVGLLALSAVRWVILEPVGGPRPDGVIAAIRRRNAQRRGIKLEDRPVDPFTRAAMAMRTGVRRAATFPGRAWAALKNMTKIRTKP